jgi:phospholipid/cholesterol/gamma-HCH transport system permease protein
MQKRLFNLGEKSLGFIRYIGEISILGVRSFVHVFIPPYKLKRVFEQMYKIGVASLPVVFLTSMFTGMVLALQSAYQLQQMSAQMYVSRLVAISMTRELGPVLTALVVAGRVGASITAEVGTMNVTEQIDALETLAENPIRYLVVPRLVALLAMLPILTVYSDILGILGGYIIGAGKLGITPTLYMNETYDALVYKDIFTGLLKSVVFAFIICIVACHEGFKTRGGAEGVGRSTTLSVVTSFILIIAADCLLTAIFYFTPFFR